MRIGVPREIMPQEDRVALLPSTVRTLAKAGHQVVVEQGAGTGTGLHDDEYVRAGATLVHTAEDVYARAEMIWKVDRPEPTEMALLRPGQILFCFLHPEADPTRARALAERGVVAFACERFSLPDGSRPMQRPMSEVAGRMAIQVGASCLERPRGGRGILLGGVAGVRPGRVTILGGGVVGAAAARTAMGLGAEVTVVDLDLERLGRLADLHRGQLKTLYATPGQVEESLMWADLVVGAVAVPARRTPVLVSRDQLGLLSPGAVVLDVSVDQGGCFETSRPSTHAEPTYVVDGILHYAVPNMPGAVARTSTHALCHVTSHFGQALADQGWRAAVEQDPVIRSGLVVPPA